MARIKVQAVKPSKAKLLQKRELYATVCYFYPQYTLVEVQKLPYRDVQLLLKVAREQEARRFFNETLIAAAPHSKKQQNVTKLTEHFKKVAGD
jgi:vancomycin permeability regulator SanA